VFRVRYGLNSYILFRRNVVLKGLSTYNRPIAALVASDF
jgi:hypothetical protein